MSSPVSAPATRDGERTPLRARGGLRRVSPAGAFGQQDDRAPRREGPRAVLLPVKEPLVGPMRVQELPMEPATIRLLSPTHPSAGSPNRSAHLTFRLLPDQSLSLQVATIRGFFEVQRAENVGAALIGSKFRCIGSTPAASLSCSEKFFVCLVNTGVKSPLNARFSQTNTRTPTVQRNRNDLSLILRSPIATRCPLRVFAQTNLRQLADSVCGFCQHFLIER